MGMDIDPFHAISISKIAHAMKADGAKIIHMEFGQPSTGAPVAALAEAHEVLDRDALGYWESVPLKQRIVRHYLETYGVEITEDQLVITCGASPALVAALASAFNPGDRIALARPGYVAYRNTIKALGMVPVEIDCGPQDNFQITAAHIEAIDPAPAGLIVASPANPTGTIIPADGLRAIAETCRARNIQIISDEIYHGLSYTHDIHSMLEFAPEAMVINSFSKYFSMAGWRIGWLLSPPSHAVKADAYCGILFLTAPSLAQHAALIAMDASDELDSHVENYRTNRQLLLDNLPKFGLTEIAPPDGAFYIYANIERHSADSMDLCKEILADTGVVLAPGLDFDPVNGHRYIRISFAVSTAETRDAIKKLGDWFASRPGLESS